MMLIDAAVLPEIFVRVLDAKEMLASGKAATAAQAARSAGISRSAFYKYKDAVFPYDTQEAGKIMTVHAELSDQPGILSGVLSAFAAAGANILTVNQNIPTEGKALVSISARIDRLTVPIEEFIRALSVTAGVERVSRVARQDN
ncbi:MAG TPA: ACT domain-containing protein [Ruminococcaceae bacterium]|jgi:chorismate mutase|nr:ACT domain-containing protein [Oscillospiraceae bacterium]